MTRQGSVFLLSFLASAAAVPACGSSDTASGGSGASAPGGSGPGTGGGEGGSGGAGGASAGAVRFEMGVVDDGATEPAPYEPPFFFEVDSASIADAARSAIGTPRQVNGCIVKEKAPYNDPHWNFMFVSISDFPELSAEVCDANVAETNADWDGYFAGANPCEPEGWQLCSWASRVLREVE
jgi:hypothetical protein